MNAAVAAAIASLLIFAAAGPGLARQLPPTITVRLLTPAVVLAAGCAAFVLAVVWFTWLGQLAYVAARGSWSPQALRLLDPVPAQVAIGAGVLLVPATGWAIWTMVGQIRGLWNLHRACRELPRDGDSPIVVIDTARLDAFTTASGRIIVTSALLDAITPAQRGIVLAHEQSHRTHRHTWWALVADLAAAVNPLLRPTAAAIRHATERWADEDATQVADRRTVAVTIAHVALLRSSAAHHATAAAAATGGQVPQRVQALLRPPPQARARLLGAAVALTIAVLATTIAVQWTAETLFELAMR